GRLTVIRGGSVHGCGLVTLTLKDLCPPPTCRSTVPGLTETESGGCSWATAGAGTARSSAPTAIPAATEARRPRAARCTVTSKPPKSPPHAPPPSASGRLACGLRRKLCLVHGTVRDPGDGWT